MSGSQNSVAQEAPNWENMTKQELHDKFAQMMTEQVHDIESRFAEAIDGVEKLIDTKLDAKFSELIARLPPQAAAVPARLRPLRFSHHFDNVHDVFSLQTHKLRVLVLLLLQTLLLLLTSASTTTTTWLIPRMRCNKKRTMNNHLHLDVHRHPIVNVATRHTLRYAMMNMCLN